MTLDRTRTAHGRLLWPFAASIALHIALMTGMPEIWTDSPAPPVAWLNARIERDAPAAAPADDQSAAREHRPDRERRERTAPQSTSETPRLPVNAAAADPSATRASRHVPAVEPATVAQYRMVLIGAARRHKLYPEHAAERRLQGRVNVRLEIGADGELSRAVVISSSGHEELDREALEMMRKAKNLTPMPAALHGSEFAVEIPVVFELNSDR